MAEGSLLISCTTPGRQDRCCSSTVQSIKRTLRPRVLITQPGEDPGVGVGCARPQGLSSRKVVLMLSRRGPGGAGGVVPPVPIPNTVVKRSSADDTAWATAWDNRPVPGPSLTLFCSISYNSLTATRDGAVVARRAHNPKVVGSNPTPATNRGRGNHLGPFVLPLAAAATVTGGQSPVCAWYPLSCAFPALIV